MITIHKKSATYTNLFHKKYKVGSDIIINFLTEPVTFKGTTLEDLFNFIIIPNKDIIQLIFDRTLGSYSLDSFISDLKNVPEDKDDYQTHAGSHYIGFERVTEIWNKDEFDGRIDMSLYPYKKKKDETYSCSFVPLYHIKDYKLKVHEKFSLTDYRPYYEDEDYDKVDISWLKGDMTLFEVLESLLFEISFHGDPQSRKEVKDDMDERVKEIEEGNAELVSWEDIKKMWQDKLEGNDENNKNDK